MNDTNQMTSAAPKLITLRSADKMPRGIIFDHGFKVLGTPLAFQGAKNPGLLFFSDLEMNVPRGTRRVIGTSFVMNSLKSKHRNLDAIAVGYDRKFKLGNMELRLLPSGMSAGSAMLEIKFKNKSILYTAGLRSAQSLNGEHAQPVAADILLVDYAVAEKKSPAPKTSQRLFLHWLSELSFAPNPTKIVLCGNKTAVFDTLEAVRKSNLPVFAHRSIYNLLRDTGFFHMEPRQIFRLERKWPTHGIVLIMGSTFAQNTIRESMRLPLCYCGPADHCPAQTTHFPFGEPDHLTGLIKYARQCGIHTVAIRPSADAHIADGFRKAGFTVFFSKIPEQLKLPL